MKASEVVRWVKGELPDCGVSWSEADLHRRCVAIARALGVDVEPDEPVVTGSYPEPTFGGWTVDQLFAEPSRWATLGPVAQKRVKEKLNGKCSGEVERDEPVEKPIDLSAPIDMEAGDLPELPEYVSFVTSGGERYICAHYANGKRENVAEVSLSSGALAVAVSMVGAYNAARRPSEAAGSGEAFNELIAVLDRNTREVEKLGDVIRVYLGKGAPGPNQE